MNDLTPRERAEIIVGPVKLRQLKSEGLTVVDAKRLNALEQLRIAAKAYTANWGRSRGGMMYRADEPEGTALPLLEALERLEGINHVDQ